MPMYALIVFESISVFLTTYGHPSGREVVTMLFIYILIISQSRQFISCVICPFSSKFVFTTWLAMWLYYLSWSNFVRIKVRN